MLEKDFVAKQENLDCCMTAIKNVCLAVNGRGYCVSKEDDEDTEFHKQIWELGREWKHRR